MAQHTPGPWSARELDHTAEPNHTYWHIEAGKGFYADKPEGDGFFLSGFMSEANAKLIAAAPELLAALKRLASAVEDLPLAEAIGRPLLAELASAEAAIAKAEGN